MRLNHFVAGAHYGYPSLYMNFNDEVVQPLADYGGGSGTGALYVQDPGLPAPYGDALYTIDWGTNEVARHPLDPNGSTFEVEQDLFLEVERPTDMHIDGASRLYVSSWRDGRYRYGDENVGYIVRLTAPGTDASQVPDVAAAGDARLVELVTSANQVHRLKAQQELLRRGADPERVRLLEARILGDDPAHARVAAIFTLKQLQGPASHDVLLQAVEDPAVRTHALRALADRKSELLNVPTAPFVDGLPPELDRAWRQFASARGHGRNIDVFRQLTRSAAAGEQFLGYAVLLHLAMQQEQEDAPYVAEARRTVEAAWNGDAAAALMRAIGYTEATGYADRIQQRLTEATPAPTRSAARFAADRLGIGTEVDAQQEASVASNLVRNVPYATLVRRVSEIEGDPALGETLYTWHACATCHTASPEEALIGPYLGDIGTRYDRAELVESIVRPAATIAQGFATHWFELEDGSRVEGFITTESGDQVEIHDQLGTSTTLSKDEIVDRGEPAGSLMPPGLVDHLTVEELASLVAYLESLDGGDD